MIVVLVLGLGWWLWPRVDRRVVGKWRCGKWVMHFRDDGLVDNFAAFDAQESMCLEVKGAARFKVVGSRFFVLDGAKGAQALLFDLQRLVMPRKFEPIYEGEIVRFDSTTLILRSPEFDDVEMVLHRVEEGGGGPPR